MVQISLRLVVWSRPDILLQQALLSLDAHSLVAHPLIRKVSFGFLHLVDSCLLLLDLLLEGHVLVFLLFEFLL